jgi:hypothetical protein
MSLGKKDLGKPVSHAPKPSTLRETTDADYLISNLRVAKYLLGKADGKGIISWGPGVELGISKGSVEKAAVCMGLDIIYGLGPNGIRRVIVNNHRLVRQYVRDARPYYREVRKGRTGTP